MGPVQLAFFFSVIMVAHYRAAYLKFGHAVLSSELHNHALNTEFVSAVAGYEKITSPFES